MFIPLESRSMLFTIYMHFLYNIITSTIMYMQLVKPCIHLKADPLK